MVLASMLAYKYVLRKSVTWVQALIFGIIVSVSLFFASKIINGSKGLLFGLVVAFLANTAIAKYYGNIKNEIAVKVGIAELIISILIGFVVGLMVVSYIGILLLGSAGTIL